MPLMDVLTMCGADIGPGVLVGGYHGKWISAEAAQTVDVSRKGFAAVGGTLGAGIIIPLGSTTCPLGEVAQVAQYLAGESAGQCGPCRLGLPDLARAVTLVALGGSALDDVRAAAGVVKGRGACSHPDGTARFALSALEVFAERRRGARQRRGLRQAGAGHSAAAVHAEQGARKLAVDWSRCDGHGLCSAVVPEFIRLDANGFPAFPQTPLPPWLENGARKAVNVCPALALRLTEARSESLEHVTGGAGRAALLAVAAAGCCCVRRAGWAGAVPVGVRAVPRRSPAAGAAAVPAPCGSPARPSTVTRSTRRALAGRPALLWFWAPWCATCASQAGSVNELAAKYGDRLGFLGVAGLGDNKAMHEFVTDLEVGAVAALDDQAGRAVEAVRHHRAEHVRAGRPRRQGGHHRATWTTSS